MTKRIKRFLINIKNGAVYRDITLDRIRLDAVGLSFINKFFPRVWNANLSIERGYVINRDVSAMLC